VCLCLFVLKLKAVADSVWLTLLSLIFHFFCFAFLISESILLFRDFPWPSVQFHDFLCLEIEFIINSMTFQGEVTCATMIHNNYSMTLTPKHDIQKIRWMYLHLHVYMYTRITLLSMTENAWHVNGTIKTCKQKVFFLYLVNKVKSNTSVKTTKRENY